VQTTYISNRRFAVACATTHEDRFRVLYNSRFRSTAVRMPGSHLKCKKPKNNVTMMNDPSAYMPIGTSCHSGRSHTAAGMIGRRVPRLTAQRVRCPLTSQVPGIRTRLYRRWTDHNGCLRKRRLDRIPQARPTGDIEPLR